MARNQDLVRNITYHLQRHLFGVDGDKGEEFFTGRAFGVLMSPGQFLSPNWDEGSLDDMFHQAALLDEILSASFTYTPQVGTISGQYKNITRNAALPQGNLLPDQERELLRLGKIVEDSKPAYLVYEGWYFDAFEAYESERAKQHPNQGRLQRLLARKNDTWRDWINPRLGKKDVVERANAEIANIIRGNPKTMWTELEDRLRNSERIALGSQYYETNLIPPVSSWSSATTSWAEFGKVIDEQETHSYSKTTTWSGSLGARWGLFNSVAIGANGTKTVSHDTSEITTINTKFEYMRVRIVRKWLDSNVFTYPFWTWRKAVQTGLLSDGGNLSSTNLRAPIGTLPFLPTSLIVVRNVVISADFKSSDIRKMNSSISGSVSAGFGPFSVRGSYTENTQQVDVRASFDGTTLKITQPQVLGFQGLLLPRTPNPDKALPFDWEEAWDPDKDKAADEASREKQRKSAAIQSALERYQELKNEISSNADRELIAQYEAYLNSKNL